MKIGKSLSRTLKELEIRVKQLLCEVVPGRGHRHISEVSSVHVVSEAEQKGAAFLLCAMKSH